MVKNTAAILASGALLAGCALPSAPVPLATSLPPPEQYTLQAAAHWNAIAGHIEQRLATGIKQGPQRPLYIAEPAAPAAPFQRALASQLASALVKDGYVVSRSPAGALKIDIDVQALTFAPGREQNRYRGETSAIAAGVWAQSANDEGARAYDVATFAPGTAPKTELLVTVSVSDQYRYYARDSTTYYVADGDRALYAIPPEDQMKARSMKTYKIQGER
jgi:uncharacterized lipoprotein YajG